MISQLELGNLEKVRGLGMNGMRFLLEIGAFWPNRFFRAVLNSSSFLCFFLTYQESSNKGMPKKIASSGDHKAKHKVSKRTRKFQTAKLQQVIKQRKVAQRVNQSKKEKEQRKNSKNVSAKGEDGEEEEKGKLQAKKGKQEDDGGVDEFMEDGFLKELDSEVINIFAIILLRLSPIPRVNYNNLELRFFLIDDKSISLLKPRLLSIVLNCKLFISNM